VIPLVIFVATSPPTAPPLQPLQPSTAAAQINQNLNLDTFSTTTLLIRRLLTPTDPFLASATARGLGHDASLEGSLQLERAAFPLKLLSNSLGLTVFLRIPIIEAHFLFRPADATLPRNSRTAQIERCGDAHSSLTVHKVPPITPRNPLIQTLVPAPSPNPAIELLAARELAPQRSHEGKRPVSVLPSRRCARAFPDWVHWLSGVSFVRVLFCVDYRSTLRTRPPGARRSSRSMTSRSCEYSTFSIRVAVFVSFRSLRAAFAMSFRVLERPVD
jgi:hypothetical protein